MSIEIIKTVFRELKNDNKWSIKLLNIGKGKESEDSELSAIAKNSGNIYSCTNISLSPLELQNDFLEEISNAYDTNGKKSLDMFHGVRAYDGTADTLSIYKLSANDLLKEEMIDLRLHLLLEAIASSSAVNDPMEYKSAYLIKGEIKYGEKKVQVKLISMKTPVTVLKHKFLYDKGTFKELDEKVLSLSPSIDVVIFDTTVYFLTLAGEKLFQMNRAFNEVCKNSIKEIKQADIISEFTQFEASASSGHNPRRFLSFNGERLKRLKERKVLKEMSKQFSIPLDSSGTKLDASIAKSPDKIVKLLCNKGMTDPFIKEAVEVDGARKWQ